MTNVAWLASYVTGGSDGHRIGVWNFGCMVYSQFGGDTRPLAHPIASCCWNFWIIEICNESRRARKRERPGSFHNNKKIAFCRSRTLQIW